MNTVDVERLMRIQSRLFDRAHESATELKPLGIAMKKRGLEAKTLYCNPAFMLLPFEQCDTLRQLSDEQLGALTGYYFAAAYAEIASSETLALRYNMEVSEAVFPTYSDDYMLLFHETAEEYDHIITFHNVSKALVGRGDAIGVNHFQHLKPVYETFEKYKDRLCPEGFGALYLLLRYLLNLALKQLEGFMASNLPEGRANPLAQQIIQGHANDEARHLTTSLELGMGLWERAEPKSRALVSSILRLSLYSMIDQRFSADLSRVWHHRASLGVLERALEQPLFEEFPASVEDLKNSWERSGITIGNTREYENSRRWLAAQIAHLAERMQLNLVPSGESFEHYQDFVQPQAARATA